MKAFLKILSATSIITLFGCSTAFDQLHTTASVDLFSHLPEDSVTNSEYLTQISAVSTEMRGMCASSAFQSYFKKTACFPSGITESQLRDRTHINKEQKKAAVRVFALQHDLNAKTRSIMIQSGDKKMMQMAEHSKKHVIPAVESLQNSLLSGAITWGEYNVARLRLFEESRKAPTND